MANRRPNFRIPAVINPDGRRCIQIMIPDHPDHVEIFAGLTRQLLDWQRWERDELKQGTLVAQVWREVWNNIDWSGEDCMTCCPEPTNRRYNENGELEVSYDGGDTWELSPADDSRLSGAIAPPLAGADGDTKKCTGATSVQEYVKTAFLEDLTEGATYADLNAAAVAIVAALGVTGIGILIAAACAAIFILGVSATVSAFTTEVWEDFKCILYCHIEDDASFTETGWTQVKAEILSTFTGVVSAVLYNWVNTIGTVGLTNSARAGFATEADCSECECDPPCQSAASWSAGTVNSTTDNMDGTTTFNVSSVDNGSGVQYIAWGDRENAGSACCEFLSFVPTTGFGIIGGAVQLCGSGDETTTFPTGGNCYHYFHVYQDDALSSPFTANVTFENCE